MPRSHHQTLASARTARLALLCLLTLALAFAGRTGAAHAKADGSARASAIASTRAQAHARKCRTRAARHRRSCRARGTANRRTHRTTRVAKPVGKPSSSTLAVAPPTVFAPLAAPKVMTLVPPPIAPVSPPANDDGNNPPPPAPPAPATPPAPPPPPQGTLAWAPPALVDPITIQLGTGYTHTTLSPTRDYIVKLPAAQKVGGTWLEGGHNVVIIGGSISIPDAAPGAATSAQRTAIYIKNATGTVHVEGVLIDGTGGGQLDGVDVAAPQAVVQLENLRIVGVHGGLGSFHADVVQPWGGVHDLRIDHLTGASNYQGFMLSDDLGPIGSAEISHVDLTATTDPTVDHGGHMLLLSSNVPACATYPVAVSDVYVTPRPGRTLANSVWPSAVASTCDGMTGSVQSGTPPSGSYVPAGAAGISYVSPGYAGS